MSENRTPKHFGLGERDSCFPPAARGVFGFRASGRRRLHDGAPPPIPLEVGVHCARAGPRRICVHGCRICAQDVRLGGSGPAGRGGTSSPARPSARLLFDFRTLHFARVSFDTCQI